MSSNVILGIDLGTTNSVMAVIRDGVPTVTPIKDQRLLPSVVGVSPQQELLVGTVARNQWAVAPELTIRSIKRKMGSGETVTMAGKTYTPQEISAFILREIKESAESALGQPVERAVITVPAYFNEVQRQATIEAGGIAGLKVDRIINEPTAAALAYGYSRDTDEPLRVLVYDLGGGTFDVSIIELDNGIVDVVATAGDNYLGGDDFDERLASAIADEFLEEHDIDLHQNHQAWARLLRAAEEAKIALSSEVNTDIVLEYIAEADDGTPFHIRREVQREEFEDLIDDLLARTIDCIDEALQDSGQGVEAIDRVLLIGGSTRIPAVQELAIRRLGQEPHLEIDPDAVVALGAAVQAGIVAGEKIDAILVDVTPLSLGIESAEFTMTGRIRGDRYVPLIRRNTTIPVQKSERFTTLFPGQKAIHVKVYQGENPTASQNILLGDFMVEDLKPNLPDGTTEVTVNFSLDVNAILDVTVTEGQSGKRTTERLKASRQRLSPEEIARSRSKLDLAMGEPSSDPVVDLDPGVTALLSRAETALEDPNLDEELAEELRQLADNILRVAAREDDEEVEALCDQLIDLLFEIEE